MMEEGMMTEATRRTMSLGHTGDSREGVWREETKEEREEA
jgi:hypothetical protein